MISIPNNLYKENVSVAVLSFSKKNMLAHIKIVLVSYNKTPQIWQTPFLDTLMFLIWEFKFSIFNVYCIMWFISEAVYRRKPGGSEAFAWPLEESLDCSQCNNIIF